VQKGEQLVLPVESVEQALRSVRASEDEVDGNSLSNIATNEFEKKLLADVVPASEMNVTFAQIGALDSIKSMLREAILLPLNRPELFRKGNLTKPSKGGYNFSLFFFSYFVGFVFFLNNLMFVCLFVCFCVVLLVFFFFEQLNVCLFFFSLFVNSVVVWSSRHWQDNACQGCCNGRTSKLYKCVCGVDRK
jgi:hypothetical protein